MVQLTKEEQRLITLLKRRRGFLEKRIAERPGQNNDGDLQERMAIRWVLEVVELAAANDCEAVFATTKLRLKTQQKHAERAAHFHEGTT